MSNLKCNPILGRHSYPKYDCVELIIDTNNMNDKRPIDQKRESAGMADIGTNEDGAIVEMTKIGERLLIIKERSIYELMFADQIDPNRTNIGLPSNIQKLIVNQGSESELVCKTFLTAKTLFKSEFLIETINIESILTLSLDLLIELIALEKESYDLSMEEKRATADYEARKNEKLSYKIPSIVDLETRCKTIFQKADHIEQILMEIISIFYPSDSLTKQSHFPRFYEVILAKYGENDSFTRYIRDTLPFMKVIRSLRNALDHRLSTVRILDFDLQPDSQIISPTVELNHKDDQLDRTSITNFLDIVIKNFYSIIEITFAYLAGKNGSNFILGNQVKEIPEERRRYKYVRYSFWAPLGQGGYYNQ
jgi:hypothetical protein